MSCKISVFENRESLLEFFYSFSAPWVRFEGKNKVRAFETWLPTSLNSTLTSFEEHHICVQFLRDLGDGDFIGLSLVVLENIGASLRSKIFKLQLTNSVSASSCDKHNRKVQIVYKILFTIALELHEHVVKLGVADYFLAHLNTSTLQSSPVLWKCVPIYGKVESSKLRCVKVNSVLGNLVLTILPLDPLLKMLVHIWPGNEVFLGFGKQPAHFAQE